MKKFIPRDKLGKKARRLLNSQRRRTWAISPVTRTVESRKVYNRKRKSHDFQDEWIRGIFYVHVQMIMGITGSGSAWLRKVFFTSS